MNFSKADLHQVRGALALLAASLVVGALAVYFSADYAQRSARAGATLADEVAQARTRLSQVEQERVDMQAYYQQYQSLLARHIIGDERRLDWIEAVEALRAQQNVFSVKYQLEPRVVRQTMEELDLGISPMKLDLGLLHEGQLLGFFDALRAKADGWYVLESCSLSRNDGRNDGRNASADAELRWAANVQAQCALGWVTLKEKSGEAKK